MPADCSGPVHALRLIQQAAVPGRRSQPSARRKSHTPSIARVTAESRPSRNVCGCAILHRRPFQILIQHQGICAAKSAPSNGPRGCARMAERISPRTRCEKLVVKPQLGHGIPKTTRKVHGGRPNASCVPNPRGSGWTDRAAPKMLSSRRLHAESASRPRRPIGAPRLDFTGVAGSGREGRVLTASTFSCKTSSSPRNVGRACRAGRKGKIPPRRRHGTTRYGAISLERW